MQIQFLLAIFAPMGKILEKLLLVLLFMVLWSCHEQPQKTGTLLDFTPKNSVAVFKVSNWNTLKDDIGANSLLSKFKKTPAYSFFSKNAPFLKELQPNSLSLLCINKVNDSTSAYTFLSKNHKSLFQLDSIKNKTVETIEIGEKAIQRITIDERIAYTALVDSVFIASSSQQLLMDILDGKTENDKTFKKAFQLPASGGFTALLKGNTIQTNDTTTINFTSWSAVDITVAPESLTAHGITMATDSVPQLLSVFKNQVPQPNAVSSLVPMNALGALSFTFSDAEEFQKALHRFRKNNEELQTSGAFGAATEVGSIQLPKGEAVFLKSIDASLTTDALARYVTTIRSFRETEIKSFSEPGLFAEVFYPLIPMKNANFVFQWEDFFVFTDTEASAEALIGAIQNNSTLNNAPYFEKTLPELSTSSSLLILKMQGEFSETLSGFFNQDNREAFQNIDLTKFPLAALQFSFDRNFAHVSLSCKEFGKAAINISKGVSEKFSLKLENALLGHPQIFENGNGSNVVVQDVANTLHFISKNGKTLWTKELGTPILGEIKKVDIYGNGNKQMAFATKDRVYVLDRNGKSVSPFPLKFRDEITQPLGVFDYDSNHKYRFVVVQDKELFLYDKKGKLVRGFGFNKTQSEIVQTPSHIRMGNKDYIVVAEESGRLNILNRVGKTRVPVAKTFNFSEIPVTNENNSFVVITKENTKERISEKGKISSLKLDVGSNYWFATLGSVKATLDDNLLRINGKLAELPIGLYSKPRIFKIANKIYVGLTETQENKVYLFDEAANLLKGFPVYGSSMPSMDGSNRHGSSVVVKGDDNSIILYTLN